MIKGAELTSSTTPILKHESSGHRKAGFTRPERPRHNDLRMSDCELGQRKSDPEKLQDSKL